LTDPASNVLKTLEVYASAMQDLNFTGYNDFHNHGDVTRWSKIIARYEIYRMTIDLPGDVVECGVFKGTSLFFWARMKQLFNPLSHRKIVGFDTFEDFAGAQDFEGAKVQQLNEQRGTTNWYDEILRIATENGTANLIELVRGDVSQTARQYAEQRRGRRIALLHLDMDIYQPTLDALHALYDLVVPGGVVLLDEYACGGWGESDAVDEFLRSRNERVVLKSFPYTMSPTAYFLKP
jgi:hypothetical protein